MLSTLTALGSSNIVYLVAITTLSYLAISSFLTYWRLRQFKGPPLAAFSRLWMIWASLNARLGTATFDAITKYGPVCRIGPNLVITSDPDIIRYMSATKSTWRRGDWYSGMKLDPRKDSVFSTQDEKIHAELRAKEAGAYLGRDIDSIETDIDARTCEFIDLIKTTYDGKSMDLALTIRFYVLDVLSTLAYGRAFGFMAANEDLWKFNETNAAFMGPLELTLVSPLFRRFLTSGPIQALAAPKETDKFGMGPALAFARKAVAERFGPDAKVKNDMLGHFIKKGLSQEQCDVEAFLQIIAGSDSTTTLIRCTIFTLIANPMVYMKLRTEIDEAVKTGNISTPVIKNSEAAQMPYLQACVWETWRMFPPLFGLKSKVAPPEGDTIKGIFFPGGIEVADHNDATCRRPDIFGDDAHIYRPERWLEADDEIRRTYERTVELIFGSGRYTCLGKHIGTMELHKAIVELMRQFDWSIVDPLKGVPYKQYSVHMHSEMYVIARSRE